MHLLPFEQIFVFYKVTSNTKEFNIEMENKAFKELIYIHEKLSWFSQKMKTFWQCIKSSNKSKFYNNLGKISS